LVGAGKHDGSRSRAARIRQRVVEPPEWHEPVGVGCALGPAALGGFGKQPNIRKCELSLELTGV
jgi:hypothetical protein